MAKSDGGKHLETLAQQLISASANPTKTQTVEKDYAKKDWRNNPNPPVSYYWGDGCLVYLAGPVSEEELDRTWCAIECQEPGSNTWRNITDLSGVGTTFEPFNGTCVYDQVTQSGTYLYRASATYSTGNSNPVHSESIEVEVVACEELTARTATKKTAAKKAASKKS